VPPTNFELAPPVKTVDGLVAVPMDIQRINAALTFDGATSSGSADVTIEFITGAQNGNPIFDLRQTITEAWLDAAPLPISKLAHHNFGGGTDAQLRVIESVLPARTTHTLRVKYTLGLPQASTAGSYQPAITWSSGPRLVFNFGFTDLGAGRYLEAWIPANLIFDQFELTLTLRILNTAIAHTLITNGTQTSLGTNHWSVTYPARFTALSPLLELRATDTLTKQSGTTVLPVSGVTVTIDVWKLKTSPTDLAAQLANIKTFLANNENAVGPYAHGNRFVAFLHTGGMEYEGGTTTGTGALQHETYHSWWARGIKPASQPDAWWDEAWTVFNVDGPGGSIPFDFTDPPVTLCSRNPWARTTAGVSYSEGQRFFQGVAALVGTANLKALMRDFYNQRTEKLTTTTDIEEFLVCRTGNTQLVDAFHRFVYGFSDPSPVPDLWLRDDPAHTGTDTWAGAFWNSPDLWVRNSNDNGTTHQAPEFGQDNWFYARVRNRSATATARHFLVTFNVKAFAGVEFQYPSDFLPCVAAASGFELGPGQSTIVKARWPAALVPPAGTHACWLASVLTRFEHPISGRHVWEHNNLAQKNLTIVDLKPGQWTLLPFVVSNLTKLTARRVLIEVVRPKNQLQLPVTLAHKSGAAFSLARELKPQPLTVIPARIIKDDAAEAPLDCGGHAKGQAPTTDSVLTSLTPGALAARQFAEGSEITFASGLTAQIPLSLRPTQQLVMGLRVSVPQTAKPGEVIKLDVVQKDEKGKTIAGGLAIEIRVR
jgi:hypothetical protein